MENKVIFKDGNFSIQRFKGIPEAAMKFLDSIAWGNEGAVYEHKNTEEHIQLLHNPTLIAILDNEKIQGTAVFCNTPVAVGKANYNCYYIRYFASSKEIRGKGVMKEYSIKVMESIRQDEKAKTVFFACIEKGNKGSYRVVESAGYSNIGVMKTNGFSRYFPKNSQRQERIVKKTDREEVLAILKTFYEGHALVQFNALFIKDNYYVIREKGEIIAGCQYHRVHWVINRMPGLSGKIIMKVVPQIPILNGLFNPKRFEFLAFEGIFYKPGHENRLSELFESLLALENLKSAMYWLSEKCPIRKNLSVNLKKGLLHSFIKDSDVYIMAAFHGLDNSETNDLISKPIYASAFDYV